MVLSQRRSGVLHVVVRRWPHPHTAPRTSRSFAPLSPLQVLLTTEAVLKFAWDPSAYTTGANANATVAEMAFFKTFAARNFGAALADQVAAIYKQYFTIPHIVTGHSDEMFGAALRSLGGDGAADLRAGNGVSNTTLAAAKTHLAAIQPSLAPCAEAKAAADALLGSVPANHQQVRSGASPRTEPPRSLSLSPFRALSLLSPSFSRVEASKPS